MDFFGIGNAVVAVAEIYFRSARATGRTAQLLVSLKDGDRVVVNHVDAKKEIERHCVANLIAVTVLVISPARPWDIHNYPRATGQTIFDHVWLQEYYLQNLDTMRRSLDQLQEETSGAKPDASHLEKTNPRWSGGNRFD